MLYDEAFLLADQIVGELSPFCHRIEVAGGIRRRKTNPHDMEIVCIPKQGTMRHKKTRHLLPTMDFIAAVDKYKAIKGRPWEKYTQRILVPEEVLPLRDGFNLDLFMATQLNWGYIMGIRCGDADFSHYVLANGWVKAGYHGKDGYLFDKYNTLVPVYEEIDLFNLIGLEWVDYPDRIGYNFLHKK